MMPSYRKTSSCVIIIGDISTKQRWMSSSTLTKPIYINWAPLFLYLLSGCYSFFNGPAQITCRHKEIHPIRMQGRWDSACLTVERRVFPTLYIWRIYLNYSWHMMICFCRWNSINYLKQSHVTPPATRCMLIWSSSDIATRPISVP